MIKPIVWTIAGSDSGGGAGIQADLQTFHDLSTFGCSIITAVTAQNSQTVIANQELGLEIINAQWQALSQDLPAKAVKLGMLGSSQLVLLLAERLREIKTFVVCDPVMVATSGAVLLDDLAIATVVREIFPQSDIITPNRFEAEKLTQIAIQTPQDMVTAAQKLLQTGAKSVLLKGGHILDDEKTALDYWTDGKMELWLSGERFAHLHTHGAGCTLSSAIAALLAQNYELTDAIVLAKMYVSQGIRKAKPQGSGPGPVMHLGFPAEACDLPRVFSSLVDLKQQLIFPDCGPWPIGLYPIVPSSQWVARLLALGVKTIQLRLKNLAIAEIEQEIAQAIAIAREYDARLFINDFWELAIKHGAYGVHLGQEDLSTADLNILYQSGLRFGVSTHNHVELARALALCPSYVAFGPIFATNSKPMAFQPQGLAKLAQFRQLTVIPLVAIGGIDLHNFREVMATGVDGIAMIAAITQASDVASVVDTLLTAT